MIISHSRKFIFLKTRKTGGTSVEIALSKICSQRDVITPITPRDELMRLGLGGHCRNFSTDRKLEYEYIKALTDNSMILKEIPKILNQKQIYYNHMPLEELYEVFQGEIGEYKIITIERHPYERVVSMANFRLGHESYISGNKLSADMVQIQNKIDKIIDDEKLKSRLCNWNIYSLKGKYAVDRILQHSILSEDFKMLCRELGLSKCIELPMSKVGNRDKSIPASAFLSQSQKDKIQQICAKEFNHFGYEV